MVKQCETLRESKYRQESGLFIIDGGREIQRAFENKVAFERLFFCRELMDDLCEQMVHACQNGHIPTVEVNKKLMQRLSFGNRLEPLLAIARMPQVSLKNIQLSTKPLVVVMEAVEKPGNLGAVLRSCDGAGVDAVIVTDPKTDIYNPNVIRASTGIVFSLPVVMCQNHELLGWLKEKKCCCVGAVVGAQLNYTQYDWCQSTALILGTEDKGLSAFWQEHTQEHLAIAMKGKADSLNVAVSCAVMVYEALRQRG